MAGFPKRQELVQVALDYAAITAIGLGIIMLFVGYPRRGAELLIAGTGLLVVKYLLARLTRRRPSRPVEVYRNVVLVNADGRELPSKLVNLTSDNGFTLGQAGEQLNIGEVIQIRVDHFRARGRIGWVNGAWAGGQFIEEEKVLRPAKAELTSKSLRTERADWPVPEGGMRARLPQS